MTFALLGLLIGPVVLHFGQKSHNRIAIPEVAQGAPPGARFATASAALIEHELDGVTGWRPNDLIIWGPLVGADNNASRQMGILLALRESVRVFKDHLTKVSSDVYDKNLVDADNLLRNDPEKWAFPSAESRYRDAAENLKAYVAGLTSDPPRSRAINVRNMELLRLVQAWSDLLGGAHAELVKDQVEWFRIDDVFYQAAGTCQVIANLIPTVVGEYAEGFGGRPVLPQLFEEIRAPLMRCSQMKPFMVLNGRDTSLVANHRRNLDAYITEARQKLYSIREELEK